MEEAKVSVGVIDQEGLCICDVCRKILSTGKYAIGIIHQHQGIEKKYVLGIDPQLMCCGEIRDIVAFFNSETEANKKAKEIMKYLTDNQEKGASSFLKILLEFHELPLKTLKFK